MENEPVIVKCEIGTLPRPMPEGMFDKMPSVYVTLSNGDSVDLFEYYSDEISFSESEFIGLTVAEARNLKTHKDFIFIQS